jgi:hypothetical protein
MNNPWWSTTTVLFMQYIFHPLNQLRWVGLFQGLWILMKVPSINLMQPWTMEVHSQDPTLFNSEPLDFIDNGGIDARCNKNAIIIYYSLLPLP